MDDSESRLHGCHVLVVEDDYFIASEVSACLTGWGCEVMGPFSSIHDTMDRLKSAAPDAAILDVNLAGQAVYPLAKTLLRRGVPTLFVTGYDIAAIKPQFRAVPKLSKPLAPRELQQAMIRLVGQIRPAR